MKKQYIVPTIDIETIETERLLAAVSGDRMSIDPAEQSDFMESKGHTFNVWGPDDEEDDW